METDLKMILEGIENVRIGQWNNFTVENDRAEITASMDEDVMHIDIKYKDFAPLSAAPLRKKEININSKL